MEVKDLSGKGLSQKLAERLAKTKSPKELGVSIEQDSAEVDGVKFAVTKAKHDGTQTRGYSIGFGAGETQYVFMVHEDKNGVLSVALNVIEYTERGEEKTKAHLKGYNLRDSTVTKIMDGTFVVPTRKFASDKEKLDWVLEKGFKDLTIEPV